MANRRRPAANRKKKAAARAAPNKKRPEKREIDRRSKERRNTKRRTDVSTPSARRNAQHEAIAVALGCIGLLTLLALVSYDASDTSLNASGST